MANIRESLRKSKVFSRMYYGLHIDDFLFSHGLFGFGQSMERALKIFLSEKELQNHALVNEIKSDIISCYKKYKSSPNEYFIFNFRKLSPALRNTYVTDAWMNSTLAQVVGRRLHDEQLNDKWNFYCKMKPWFKRKVIRLHGIEDRADFLTFASNVKDMILKPNAAALGSGIRVVSVYNEEDAQNLFTEIIRSGGVIVAEELIRQSEEMEKWNSSSVNTVRLSAFLNRDGFHVLSSVLRTGRKGSVVDNAGQGGVSAAVDPLTGCIVSDGMDKKGHWFSAHPDSGHTFRGAKIPRWQELLVMAEEIHRTIPNQMYVGWDFALTADGWVLIEGNWGQLGAQQVALGHGLKPQFEKYLKAGFIK